MKKALVAGATGYLGHYLVEELVHRDYWVRALTRSTQKAVDLGAKVDDWFVGQVTDPDSVAAVCEGVDVVLSCVGITRQKDGCSYEDVDFGGNWNLLQSALRHHVKRFVYISVLGADQMRHLKLVKAKEKFVGALRESGMDHLVIRPNGYFSDMRAFLKMGRRGRVFLFGDGGFRINPIDGRDLAEFCVNAIDAPETEVSVGGPVVYTHREIAEAACAALGTHAKITHLPVAVGSGLASALRHLTSSRFHGPIEFTLSVLTRDMIGPLYGSKTLPEFFVEEVAAGRCSGS